MARCPTGMGVLLVAVAIAGCDSLVSAAQKAGVVPTFEQHCASTLPPTRVTVEGLPVNYAIDETLPYSELTLMGAEAGTGDRVIGLTHARLSHSATIVASGVEDPRTRRVCVRPEIRLTLSMQPMTVYVGREFSGDPCRRGVILEHEAKHVAVYRQYLQEAVEQVRDEVAGAYGNAVMMFGSREEAQREIEAALGGYLGPAVQRSSQELKRRQAEVDTPAEYARVSAACGGMPLTR
jgi:hypothetical protein